MKPIDSVQKLSKAQIQNLKLLTQEAKERAEQNQVVIYGSKILKELPKSISIIMVFTTEEKPYLAEAFTTKGIPHYLCKEEELVKISGQKNPEGIGAIIALPKPSDLSTKSSLLILDEVQDPGNLGTLIRSAYALGVEGILFVKGGCDPFGEKALRSSQGAIFHMPYMVVTPEQLYAFVEKTLFTVLVADMDGEPIESYLKTPLKKVALLLGNEGQGASHIDPKWQKVCIPMQNQAESLNVAIAGSIFMYLLKQPSQGITR